MANLFSNLFGGGGPAAQSFAAPNVVPPVTPGQFGSEPVSMTPVGGPGQGSFSQLLADPMIAQSLLAAAGQMQSGAPIGSAMSSGFQTFNQLQANKAKQEALMRREGRDVERLGLEKERAGIAKTAAEAQLSTAESRKQAALAKATTDKEKAAIEKKYKEAQIGKLTAETAKLEADMDTELKGTDPKLWGQALETVLESTALGDKPSVKTVTAMYNQLAPEGKKVILPFTSTDLKSALESSGNSQLSLDDQVKIIQSNYGPAAAKRFRAALDKRNQTMASQPSEEESTSLIEAMLGG